MQYKTKTHKIHTDKHKLINLRTVKWAQCDQKPNPENCKNCSSKCAYDYVQIHTQYNTEQF